MTNKQANRMGCLLGNTILTLFNLGLCSIIVNLALGLGSLGYFCIGATAILFISTTIKIFTNNGDY